jgi:hypothetical protein
MLEVQSKLKLSALLEPLTFKSFHLASNLKKFIFLSDNKNSSFLKRPIDDQKQYINTAIKILTKPLSSGLQKIWVKLLFIDTFLSNCQCELLTRELV